MRTSDAIDQISQAIAAVQSAVPTVEKTSEVKAGQYNYNYAPHDLVWAAARPACEEHKIAVIQAGDEGAGGTQWLVTLLVHTPSGQWISGRIRVESAKAGMQGLGASWSYARRIGLLAALG